MALRLLARTSRDVDHHDLLPAEHRLVEQVQVVPGVKSFPNPSTSRPYRGAPMEMA